MRQLVSAIYYCHEVKSLSHRDIKPENLMLDGRGKLVLCDFGISEFFKSSSDLLNSVGGTVRFMAPEMFSSPAENQQIYGKSVDVWALGVTLYKLLTNEYPYPGKTIQSLHEQQKKPPRFDKIKSKKVTSLLKKMLQLNPSSRPPISDLIEDPWLTSNGQEAIDLDLDSVSSGSR